MARGAMGLLDDGHHAERGGAGENALFKSKDHSDADLRNDMHIIIYVFLSIALYNVVELVFHIAYTFKRFRGLYCWSCAVATCGIAFEAIGVFMGTVRGSEGVSPWIYCTFILVGWASMVPGQSLVLYSRLHIVLHSHALLRFILTAIIVNAICLGVPLFTLLYLENSAHPEPYLAPYSIFEKFQLSLVFVQEVFISACYIFETCRILRCQRGLATSGSRRIMAHLILVNFIAIVVDASILGLEFSHHYDIQMAWKPLAYSIKLKLEFSVLNRLVELSQRVRANRSLSLMVTPTGAEVDPAAPGLPLGFTGGGCGGGGGGGDHHSGAPASTTSSGNRCIDGAASALSSRRAQSATTTGTTSAGEDRKGRSKRDTFDDLDFSMIPPEPHP